MRTSASTGDSPCFWPPPPVRRRARRAPRPLDHGRAGLRRRPQVAGPRIQPDVHHPAGVGLHELREAVPVPDLRERARAAGGHRRRRERRRRGGDEADRVEAPDGGALARPRRPHRRRQRLRRTPERHSRSRRPSRRSRRPSAIQDGAGSIDLGGRVIDILHIPGHQPAHLAYYDRQTGILLTGDHLYPGRLYVSDFAAYEASTRRLVEFTATRPVAHILGCHIEQSDTPFVDYPVRTTYQPKEHSLELGRGVLLELLAGLESMRSKPEKRLYRDFTIWPR